MSKLVTLHVPLSCTIGRALLPNVSDAEQTMGMPATHPQRYTAADVLAMPEQPGKTIEVIDGELFVLPAPSLVHQEVVGSVYVTLRAYARSRPIGVVCLSPADIIPTPDTLVQPDVFVAPFIDGRRPKAWSEMTRLVLAVEVLSPYSQRRDRVVKRHLYARMGCEYWIFDPDARLVERWSAVDARPEICEDRLTWHPDGATEPLTIDLAALFAEAIGE
ncbi:MAG: Uma2 family endonuclease [Gemmatimonadaceae bacterium]